MINRRRMFGLLAAAVAILAIGLAAIPFVASFSPSVRAKASVASIALDSVAVGASMELKGGSESTFVIRRGAEEFVIFRLLYVDPPGHYSHGSQVECTGIRIFNDTIYCEWGNDPAVTWDMKGNPSQTWVPKLEIEPYRVTGGIVRYGDGA